MKQVRFGKTARDASKWPVPEDAVSAWRSALNRIPPLTFWGVAGLVTGFVAAAITCW